MSTCLFGGRRRRSRPFCCAGHTAGRYPSLTTVVSVNAVSYRLCPRLCRCCCRPLPRVALLHARVFFFFFFWRQVRHLGLALPGQGGVAAFINKALTPPGAAALDNALTLLARIGAFRTNESLTPLVGFGDGFGLVLFSSGLMWFDVVLF